jgi:transposase
MVVADIREILVQWDAGATRSQIARALGYSRPTVRKYVDAAARLGLSPGQRRRNEAEWEQLTTAAIAQVAQQRPSGAVRQDVAAYHAYLDQHVGQVKLSVLHQRLRDEEGLRASWGSFYRYIRATWPARLARGPQATVRLADPPPGAEAQVDFFYVRRWFDPEAGRERKLYAFLMTLSHSRHAFLYPVLAEDGEAWLAGHSEAFAFFGGVPKRIVPDNLTAGILKADRYDPRLNRAYGELARYYGCLVDPARARHPKDKPRVERNVQYARDSFFAGRDFATLAQMRREARRWSLQVAGPRVHGTTGEVPLTVFRLREAPALLPLPPTPWEAVSWVQAKLRPDCHLVVGKTEYSAPYQHIGAYLDVRLGRSTVQIYAGQTLLTTHDRIARGRATRLEHYPPAGQAFLRATPRACVEAAQTIGAATTRLVQGLLQDETTHHLREAQAVLRLCERYAAADLEHACSLALESGDGRLRTVRGLLDRGVRQLEPAAATPVTPTSGAFLRGPETFAAYSTTEPEPATAHVASPEVPA